VRYLGHEITIVRKLVLHSAGVLKKGMTALEAATPVEEDAQDDDLARYEEKRSTSQEYLTVAKNAMKESRFRHAAVVLTDAIATCRARSIQADHSI